MVATADVLSEAASHAPPRASRSSASPPSTGPRASTRARDKLERKGLDAIVVNDISRADDRLRLGGERGHDRRCPTASITFRTASKPEVAAAVLDFVQDAARGAEGRA